MKTGDILGLGLAPEIWSLLQRGLEHAGHDTGGTFAGKPGPKTRAALDAYLATDQNTNWYDIARDELGVKEYSGSADSPRVVEYLSSVDTLSRSAQRNDETPWCSAFVNWVMEKSGRAGTENAAARSWMKWDGGKQVSNPQRGDIVIYWRGSKNGWQGHVGFVDKLTANYIYTLGGNQHDAVTISRYSKSRVLGFVRPS